MRMIPDKEFEDLYDAHARLGLIQVAIAGAQSGEPLDLADVYENADVAFKQVSAALGNHASSN